MSSREKILSGIKANQPSLIALPDVENFVQPFADVVEKFKTVLKAIGGNVHAVQNVAAIIEVLKAQFADASRIISVLPELNDYATLYQQGDDPHLLNDVDVAIIKAHFGVAENGAVWVTEAILQERVLPFICQHLVAIIDKNTIVPTMHQAYEQIAGTSYGFGTFIAGPSKTADIEQSLVLGAHGPKTMTVFILA
ncbi:LUD domain-containing protein [Ferruginibacter paludis]|uniref:LutC/YkgG family protein n=1 Tax=Ferruginibacter paludis TaxID=1310417 RepID=UPI0025B4046E|nr:LUD domain-containing protein [Ferruginibacter paludis]MDN3657194.1 LUD domain-containing protein [Ferruginibacter paludis]